MKKAVTKKLLFPTWAYKSRRGYAQAKYRQWDALLKALFKFQHGSAWLPPKVRNLVDPVNLDAANKAMNNYIKKAKTDNNGQD